ncbi:PQQ-binding-like beta-propeller repeat protein [Streptomyces sp. NPDC001856]|uniref:PQQ-binding-like beta-propeller repeat protein n=1 Tax=Streptomyces sp. NPDC001856 TaxID=3154399 RepID=UPI0033168179
MRRVACGLPHAEVSCLRGRTGTPTGRTPLLLCGLARPAVFDQLWMHTTGDWVFLSSAVVDGTVYIGSNDRKVYSAPQEPVTRPSPAL